MVPGYTWAPHMGTGMVPGRTWAPEGCPGAHGLRNGTHGHRMGDRAHKGTGMVPGHTWEPKGYPGTLGNRKGAWHAWAPEGCPGTHGHRNGARAHMGTGMVPGHKWAPEGYPGTLWNRKGARARMYTRCDFVVYSGDVVFVDRIWFDLDYWVNIVLPKLKSFYAHVAHEMLCGKYFMKCYECEHTTTSTA